MSTPRAMLPPPPQVVDADTLHAVRGMLRASLTGDEITPAWRLFAEGQRLPLADAAAAFGSALPAFIASRLLEADADTVIASVALQSLEDTLIASDRRDAHRAGAADFVLGLGPVTQRVTALMPRRDGASVLDLGCGGGVLAILASRTAAQVTALDISPRAVAFTRFNAALNECTNIVAEVGDLYAPVAGRRFDIIVANAPYAISPDTTFLYRDGGAELRARIARDTPAHLADGGIALLAMNWPETADTPWQAEIAGQFADAGCDLWVLATEHFTPDQYARLWLEQQYREQIPAAERERWRAAYAAAGYVRLHGGYWVLSRPRGREPWIEMRDLPPFDALGGQALARTLAARDIAARHDDAALMGLMLTPVAGLLASETRRATTSGWQVASVDLRPADGLRIRLRVDPLAAELLGWLDGSRSVADAARAFAAARSLPPEPLLGALPALLRRLLEAGLLVTAQRATIPLVRTTERTPT